MNAPACVRHVMRCPVGELHAGEGRVRAVRLDHMREEGGALIPAEAETEAAQLPAGTTDIWSIDDRLLAYRQDNETVTLLSDSRVYPATDQLVRIVNNVAADGGDAVTALCKDALYVYSNNNATSTVYTPAPSVTNVVAHRERLFGASGKRIRYTKPLEFRSWTPYGEQDAGYCDLPTAGGDVVDVVAMRDRVYFLREYAVTRLTGYADVYNFRLQEVPYAMGKIVSFAAVGGECAYFFTESGLCRFDGSAAGPAAGADDGDIDLAQPIRVDTWRGRGLAASVKLKDGTQALYIYEPAVRRGRFVRRSFEKFAAANAVVLMRAGKAYRLTGRALPEGGCSLTARFALASLGDGEKRLEAVFVEGEGEVYLEAWGEDGVPRSCRGKAGEWLDFAAGVRAEQVTVRISSQDEGIAIRALTLRVRREGRV